MTPLQPEASAQSPCTSTTVGFSASDFELDASVPGARPTARAMSSMAPAATAASRPIRDRGILRATGVMASPVLDRVPAAGIRELVTGVASLDRASPWSVTDSEYP